jgi:hypothetical protein
MSIKKTSMLLLLLFIVSVGWGQCPFGNGTRVECRYGCDNFTDEDGDGFCDFSRLFATETKDTVKETKETIAPLKQTKENANSESAKINSTIEEEDEFIDTSTNQEIITSEENTSPIKPFKKPYHLILISVLTLGSYFVTFLLSRFGILQKKTHRRIWNTLLLFTATVSCLFGFFLVIQLNYGFLGTWYRPILTWHVECGIAMTIIAMFHVIWHLPYYKFKNFV